MTAAMTDVDAPTLSDWLDALSSANNVHDARKAGFEAIRAGFDYQPVVCSRCPGTEPMTFASAVRHVTSTESTWQEQHREDGEHAGLHRPGDLRPASAGEALHAPAPWTRTECRECAAEVIWADTRSGGRMAVDADPTPAGTVLLVMQRSLAYAPLVLGIHPNDDVPASERHAPHHTTCERRGDTP